MCVDLPPMSRGRRTPRFGSSGVTSAEGGRDHAEIVLAREHTGKASRFVVRVNREGDERRTKADLRRGMREELDYA